MKMKFLIPILLAIILGFFSARVVYGLYKNDDEPLFNTYFIQVGVYEKEDLMNEFIKEKELNSYLVVNENNKKYIYVGITTNSEVVDKIISIYNSLGIDTYVKKKKINNRGFYENLEQYDLLLNGVEKQEDILSINKVIFSSYEEMVINS